MSIAFLHNKPIPHHNKQILDIILKLPGDINLVFANMINHKIYDINRSKCLISQATLEYINNTKRIKPDLLLEYGAVNGLEDVVKWAIKLGADPSAKAHDRDLNILEVALYANCALTIVDTLLQVQTITSPNIVPYIMAIIQSDINKAAEIIKRFPNIYKEESFYEQMRADGQSDIAIKMVTDMYKLAEDYLYNRNLSEDERKILTTGQMISIEDTESTLTFQISNPYGFNPLHLALLAHKTQLAIALIKEGYSLYSCNNHGITALQLIGSFATMEMSKNQKSIEELLNITVKNIGDVDYTINDSGESLVDVLFNTLLKTTALEYTKDPLFSFLKKDSNLTLAEDAKVHIAISDGSESWSQGIWSAARVLMKKHHNIQFHLIQDKMVDDQGEFLKQFDAIINPGAEDSYPADQEFSKRHCQFDTAIEKMYQKIVDISDKLGIPYLGICAGAQHLALYHGSTLMPVTGYHKGSHNIELRPGTLLYFMAMTKNQEKLALDSFQFPKIVVKGDTAHHFAAKTLADGLRTDGLSEDQIIMAYSHENKMRFGIQFHPEHKCNINNTEDDNQVALLESFLNLATSYKHKKRNPTINISDREKQLAEHWVIKEVVDKLVDNVGNLLLQSNNNGCDLIGKDYCVAKVL
ncbi:gamma-glutamyl-gamma-aminobutyrate hydrolase family protein [Candidatus Tisiphia endosymbiont of Nemotelus uliginosus]|uniref:gamma-glutamyl-gamma-aminobutyrate hydrolase family protein n=1 Tax=Candidatus Tisiphia endosymbiont of Nemotelus uliginosus TaxID=3077926 RepID=UPI0035C8E486